MTEAFRAQVPGMAIADDAKLSPPEKHNYRHAAEKAPPFVMTRDDNQILIKILAKQGAEVKIKYGPAGEFSLGHEIYCSDEMGRLTKGECH